jgi:hypothetical protein
MRMEVEKLRKQIKQYKMDHEAFMESLGGGGQNFSSFFLFAYMK